MFTGNSNLGTNVPDSEAMQSFAPDMCILLVHHWLELPPFASCGAYPTWVDVLMFVRLIDLLGFGMMGRHGDLIDDLQEYRVRPLNKYAQCNVVTLLLCLF